MTTIISSQRYRNEEIVAEKISAFEAAAPAEIVLIAWAVNLDEYDCAILSDGHHALEAARQLNIPVRFEITNHPEHIDGIDLLEQAWIDSDWYDIETGSLYF